MGKYVMSIDQGTTSSRAIVFDKKGNIIAKAQKEFTQIYPHESWVEHDPEEIIAGVKEVIAAVIGKVGAENIDCIGVTNQRETVVVWDKNTGKPVYNAIVWQCRRTADYCETLKAAGLEKLIYSKTGLQVDAYFSATKIRWILKNVEGAKERAENGELVFGTMDTYVMWCLSGGAIFATDYTNASRTMLFNIHDMAWDDDLIQMFDIPQSMLPAVYPSGHFFGVTSAEITGREIPVCGDAGDQQAALYGHLCTKKGSIKNTYGTGCFVLMNTGDEPIRSKRGLVTTVAASRDGQKPQYVLEGSVFVGGAVIQWLRDELKIINSSPETEEIALSVKDTGGVYLVPAFVGLGAPHWDAKARGLITGITRGTSRAHIVRAALESIAYQVVDVMHAMQSDADCRITSLGVDGGACANNFLMQFQADILDCNVVRPKIIETTALGVAYLAGLNTGYWKDEDEIRENVGVERVFTPNMSKKKRSDLLMGWADSIARTKFR